MTITDQYHAVASSARTATERSMEAFRQGAEAFTNQTSTFTKLPKIDLAGAIDQYFELVQRSVDTNRDLAGKWLEMVTTVTGVAREQAETWGNVVREQAETVGNVVREQANRVVDLTAQQVQYVEAAAQQQTETVDQV